MCIFSLICVKAGSHSAILLYFYSETKEILYEPMNLKGVVYMLCTICLERAWELNNLLGKHYCVSVL